MHSGRKPPWLKKPVPKAAPLHAMEGLLRRHSLHTVCESALCPNKGTCFEQGTATFLIMGDICTRACGFCAVRHGIPGDLDASEPEKVADAAAVLGLRHVVVTSVTRDDLPDGGAAHYVATVRAIRRRSPDASVEVLVPDFAGRRESAAAVLAEAPEVFNHNLETIARLYPVVRPRADYARSVDLLRYAATARSGVVKSGFMVGLGETDVELRSLLEEVAGAGVHVVTVGQYLRPTRDSLPVAEYVAPDAFDSLRKWGEDLGLQVEAGPFVRSSFRARESFLRAGNTAAIPS